MHEFCSRFIGAGGVVLYIGDTASNRAESGKLMVLETQQLEADEGVESIEVGSAQNASNILRYYQQGVLA